MNMVINASEAIGEGASVVTVRTGVEVCEESYFERSRVEEKPPPGRFVFFEVSDTRGGMNEGDRRGVSSILSLPRSLRGVGLGCRQWWG